jgi:general stress protein 26
MTMPQMETLTALKLDGDLAKMINEAYVPNDFPILVAYVNEDGLPTMTFRGSTHVHSETELGVWARHADGAFVRSVATNPNVHVLYREPNPEGGMSRAIVNMRGTARVVTDDAERQRVYDESPEVERDADAEQKGTAVVVDLKSISGFFPGFRLNMTR